MTVRARAPGTVRESEHETEHMIELTSTVDDRYLSDEHRMLRDMVREFAENEIAPIAREVDRDARFPWANVAKMAELGLFGVPWPEK